MLRRRYFSCSAKLGKRLREGLGTRVGESAVASRRVHTIDVYDPGVVKVLTGADAGRAFYHRGRPDEIVHVDIFHDLAVLSPWRIASSIQKAVDSFIADLSQYREWYAPPPALKRLFHYIDLQTAAGGGRASGRLCFGRRQTLCQAHANHVHLAMLLPEQWATVTFYLVEEIEKEITAHRVGIRRVEGIIHEEGGLVPGQSSPYSAPTDSLLNSRDAAEGDGEGTGTGSGISPACVEELVEEAGGAQELADLLNPISGQPGSRALQDADEALLEKLATFGLLENRGGGYQLTPYGEEFRRYLLRCARELDALWKRSLPGLGLARSNWERTSYRQRKGVPAASARSRQVISPEENTWLSELAVPETVNASLARTLAPVGAERWRIGRDDIRCRRVYKRNSRDICLVLDGSASMAGARLRAARHLLEYLLSYTRDRVAVVVFRGFEARLVCPLTRDRSRVRRELRRLKPLGLTPMAAGIREAAASLQGPGVRNPFMLMITDGVPTVSTEPNSGSPVDQALAAADQLKKTGLPFACIGLQPNRSILDSVVQRGGGTLYVVDELRPEVLVSIAREELGGAGTGARGKE